MLPLLLVLALQPAPPSNAVVIVGAVPKPGTYSLTQVEPNSVSTLVSLAGGFRNADPALLPVLIVRQKPDGTADVLRFPLRRLIRERAAWEGITLRSGDLVIVQ